jgi:hypothetical protein
MFHAIEVAIEKIEAILYPVATKTDANEKGASYN